MDALYWAEARERLGLNANPSDAWQLVPLSFVLDWFIPIQDFIDQFVVPDREVAGWFTEIAAWSSVKTTRQLTARSTVRYVEKPGTQYVGLAEILEERGQTSMHTASVSSYIRTPLDQLPGISEVPIYIPHLGLPARASQWLTGMELISSRLLGNKSSPRSGRFS